MNESLWESLGLLPGMAMPPVALAGLLGNAAILQLFKGSTSVALLFRGLAVADFGVLASGALLYFPLSLFPLLSQHLAYLNYIAFASWLLYPLSNVVQMVSVYHLILISAERYIAVTHPLRAATLCTKRRALVSMCLVWAWGGLFNAPKLWEMRLERVREDDDEWWQATEEWWKLAWVYRSVYTMWLHLLFQFLIPWALAVPLNVAIVSRVRHAAKERRRMSRSEAREAQVTRMILALVCSFCLANSLPFLLAVFEALVPPTNHLHSHPALYALQDISNLLVQINSAINFFILYNFNRSFRNSCRRYKVFRWLQRGEEEGGLVALETQVSTVAAEEAVSARRKASAPLLHRPLPAQAAARASPEDRPQGTTPPPPFSLLL